MDSVPVSLGLIYVALGGALGSGGRYLVGVAVSSAGKPGWAATFLVNMLGAFAMGLLLSLAPARRTTLLLGTGVLGGFTTFSTLTADTAGLFDGAGDWRGAAYAFGSVIVGVAAFYAGGFCGRAVSGG